MKELFSALIVIYFLCLKTLLAADSGDILIQKEFLRALSQNDIDLSQKIYNQLSKTSHKWWIQTVRADYYYNAGLLEQAAEEYEKIIQDTPEDYIACLKLMQMYTRWNNTKKAEYLQKILEKNSSEESTVIIEGFLFMDQGKTRELHKNASFFFSRKPQESDAFNLMAAVFLEHCAVYFGAQNLPNTSRRFIELSDEYNPLHIPFSVYGYQLKEKFSEKAYRVFEKPVIAKKEIQSFLNWVFAGFLLVIFSVNIIFRRKKTQNLPRVCEKNSFKTVWVITGIAFAVRLYAAYYSSLWIDELITYEYVTMSSFSELLKFFIQHETHPPLYYIVVKLFCNVFGSDNLTLRFPSVLFGTAAIPLFYQLASRLISGNGKFAAVLIFALNPYTVHCSAEARHYSLVLLLSVMCLDRFYLWYSTGDKRQLHFFLITAAAGVYTFYYFVLVLIPLNLYLLFNENREQNIRFIQYEGVLGILLVPWLAAANSSVFSPGFQSFMGTHFFQHLFERNISTFLANINEFLWFSEKPNIFSMLFIFSLFTGMKTIYYKTQRVKFMLLIAFLPLIFGYVLSFISQKILGFSICDLRYFIMCLPGIVIFTVFCLGRLPGFLKQTGTLLVVFLTIQSLTLYMDYYMKTGIHDFAGILEEFSKKMQTDELVTVSSLSSDFLKDFKGYQCLRVSNASGIDDILPKTSKKYFVHIGSIIPGTFLETRTVNINNAIEKEGYTKIFIRQLKETYYVFVFEKHLKTPEDFYAEFRFDNRWILFSVVFDFVPELFFNGKKKVNVQGYVVNKGFETSINIKNGFTPGSLYPLIAYRNNQNLGIMLLFVSFFSDSLLEIPMRNFPVYMLSSKKLSVPLYIPLCFFTDPLLQFLIENSLCFFAVFLHLFKIQKRFFYTVFI